MAWQTGNNLRNSTLITSVRAAVIKSPAICVSVSIKNIKLHAYGKMTPNHESPPST